MIRHTNESGSINISTSVYTEIAGTAASNCFGVKGMAARSVKDGVYRLLRKESAGKGVRVIFHDDGTISIDLHIMVVSGYPSTPTPFSLSSRKSLNLLIGLYRQSR